MTSNKRTGTPLQFRHVHPVATGRARLVFRHPENPALLVKVLRPEVIKKSWSGQLAWRKAVRRFRQYVTYVREIQEYIAVYARENAAPAYLQKVIGLVETDLGLGLVIEAAQDPAGNLAPTLRHMVRDQTFDEDAQAALEEFFTSILNSDVVVADLHAGNVVYAWTPEKGRHFVLIDGIGVSTILPFKALSRTLSRRSKNRKIQKLRTRITPRQKPPDAASAMNPPSNKS